MHIREKIGCLDLFVKKISATRNSSFTNGTATDRLQVKREIKHSFKLPRKKKNSFHITVKDRLTFGKTKGPFSIEVIISGMVMLREEMEPGVLRALLSDSDNINFLVNQGLHHSCAAIAYLTDQMGFSPIVLAPRYR